MFLLKSRVLTQIQIVITLVSFTHSARNAHRNSVSAELSSDYFDVQIQLFCALNRSLSGYEWCREDKVSSVLRISSIIKSVRKPYRIRTFDSHVGRQIINCKLLGGKTCRENPLEDASSWSMGPINRPTDHEKLERFIAYSVCVCSYEIGATSDCCAVVASEPFTMIIESHFEHFNMRDERST